MVSDRGQAHTLEAIIAGLVLLSSVIFALQITAVTPLSASTSNQHIENQQEASAEAILSMSVKDGSLRRSLLYWNSTGERFHNGTARGYYTDTMPTDFGQLLERSFGARGIAYNVYVTTSGTNQRTRMIYQGVPSDNAVQASRSIVLTNTTRLYNADFSRGGVINDTSFYANDVGSGGYYNTLRVQVVVWRI